MNKEQLDGIQSMVTLEVKRQQALDLGAKTIANDLEMVIENIKAEILRKRD